MEGESVILSPAVHYAIAFIYFMLSIATVILNSIVLFTFIMDRSLLFPANFVILSIAVSDWLVGLVSETMGGVANASSNLVFSYETCLLYAFVTTFFGLGTMLQHAAFAFDRYLVISRPMKAQHSARQVLVAIALLWAFAFIWSLFPLFGWSAYGPEAGDIACSIRWQSSRATDTSYIIFLFVFFYFIPLTIIGASYIAIFRNVRYMTKNAQKIWGTNAAATLETVKASWKMAKIGMIMVFGFFFAWTPYAVVSFYAAFVSAEDVSIVVAAIPAIFAKTSTLYNPIIYFFTYKSFRESLLTSWRRYRNRNMVQPFHQASETGFVVRSRATRANDTNASTSVEEITL